MDVYIQCVMKFAVQKSFCKVSDRQHHFNIAPSSKIRKAEYFYFFHLFLSWCTLRSAAADCALCEKCFHAKVAKPEQRMQRNFYIVKKFLTGSNFLHELPFDIYPTNPGLLLNHGDGLVSIHHLLI